MRRARVDDDRVGLLHVGHVEGGHGAGAPHVVAHQPLQGGRVDDVEAHAAAERAGLPVLGRADGVSHQAFEGERCPHLHHGLPKDGVLPGLLNQQAWVELYGVHMAVHLLQQRGHFLVSWGGGRKGRKKRRVSVRVQNLASLTHSCSC